MIEQLHDYHIEVSPLQIAVFVFIKVEVEVFGGDSQRVEHLAVWVN